MVLRRFCAPQNIPALPISSRIRQDAQGCKQREGKRGTNSTPHTSNTRFLFCSAVKANPNQTRLLREGTMVRGPVTTRCSGKHTPRREAKKGLKDASDSGLQPPLAAQFRQGGRKLQWFLRGPWGKDRTSAQQLCRSLMIHSDWMNSVFNCGHREMGHLMNLQYVNQISKSEPSIMAGGNRGSDWLVRSDISWLPQLGVRLHLKQVASRGMEDRGM